MSTPKRYPTTTERNVGGWAYEVGEQMAFAMACQNERFGLAAFDDFLDTLPPSPLLDELLRWRAEAFGLHQSGNRKALHWCLQAIWVVMKSEFTLDGVHPMLEMSMRYSKAQSWKGGLGAEKRWAGPARDVVGELIDALKGSRYEDWTSREKWDELIGRMDVVRLEEGERLDPIEQWVKGDADKSTISYNGDNGKPLTYKTFKNRLSEK